MILFFPAEFAQYLQNMIAIFVPGYLSLQLT
jgi:hypothetical protein